MFVSTVPYNTIRLTNPMIRTSAYQCSAVPIFAEEFHLSPSFFSFAFIFSFALEAEVICSIQMTSSL